MIPDYSEHPKFMEYINMMPEKDHPLIFGLNGNADMTFRLNESTSMLNTLLDTMPKEASGSGGKSREEEVKEKLETDLIKQLPANFIEIDVEERLKYMKGPKGLSDVGKGVPLNVFLLQEIQRFQSILDIVRSTMLNMVQAIDGTIIMTLDIVESINAIYDFRVPKSWQFDPTGAEISWLTASLAGWIKGLTDRHFQLYNWIYKERPSSFWLTGFFNPQGFLTAMKQEVTRQRKSEAWSLDEVEYTSNVQKEIVTNDDGRLDKVYSAPNEGVLIHGLYLEGAFWQRGSDQCLEEQTAGAKDLYQAFPIIHMSAESTAPTQDKHPHAKKQTDANSQKMQYLCPIYKYPKRNDKYLITRINLNAAPQSGGQNLSKGVSSSMNWKLKGVALLCCKE